MLQVKTKLKPSGIHGIGLFADQFIPKGTVTWKYEPRYDVAFTQEQIDALPQVQKDFLNFFTYLDKDLNKFILCSDNQRHINHAKTGELENIHSTPTEDIAARDIQEGQELLCDYNKFDSEYFDRMNIKHAELN
ncbi:MAG: SET domain-containing protein-lysine N-methyltransferase [Patescibacteria group bacterium]